jgi:succinate dehydrogenase hydrophobic anchor subunit
MAHVMTSLHAFMHDWYGIDLIMLDYLMGLAQINNLIILITLWLEINNTGMIIDLTLTQFILLEFIRLY